MLGYNAFIISTIVDVGCAALFAVAEAIMPL